MNAKGFTFEQIAVLILVIMGLTVAVVLAATQLSRSGSQLSQLGGQSGTGVDDAGIATQNLGTKCIAAGGFCYSGDSCATGYAQVDTDSVTADFQDDCTKICCKAA